MNCKISTLNSTLAVLLIFLITGCAAHRPETDPARDKKAFAMSVDAVSRNQDIISSRGSGWAVLETPEKTDRYRFAWAAVYPNKIRMTFLLSGLPVETIIMSKKVITFLSYTGRHDKISYYSEDPDMERFTQIPVKMSEIILLLLGRTPIKHFDDAYFTHQDNVQSHITLHHIEKKQTQYLQFHPLRYLESLTVTDSLGDTVYKLSVKEYKTFDNRQIPALIILTDTYSRKLTLDMTNFKTNPAIKEDVFKLTGL